MSFPTLTQQKMIGNGCKMSKMSFLSPCLIPDEQGAERKVRDEERKQSRKKSKSSDGGSHLNACEQTNATVTKPGTFQEILYWLL